MSLIIRSAVAGDYDAVHAIIRHSYEEHVVELPHIFAKLDRVIAMGWYRSFSDSDKKTILIAELNGSVAGVAMLEMKQTPHFAALVPRNYAYINEIAVDPRYRRCGIGSRLVQASMAWARERQADGMELHVWEFNQAAVAFYESLGLSTWSRTMGISF